MKFKTFRNIAVAGGIGLGALGIFLLARPGPEKPVPPQPATGALPVVADSDPQIDSTPATATGSETPGALRDLDQKILARARAGISSDREKDAFPGAAYKVSLYKDAGQSAVNRIKVDLDRDEKWDEKWTLSGTTVKRQVSSADDDKTYDQEYLLDEATRSWRGKDQPAATTALSTPATATTPTVETGAAVPPGGQALRAMDAEIIKLAAAPASSDKAKDAAPGRAWKVNLYRDAGFSRWNRAKVDLDRDEKWDEKWTFEDDGTVKRQIAPADDESYTTEYRLRAGAWAPKS